MKFLFPSHSNKHDCPASKNGLSREQLLFLIAEKHTPNLRHMLTNTELLIIQMNLNLKNGDHINKIEGHWTHEKCNLPKFGV